MKTNKLFLIILLVLNPHNNMNAMGTIKKVLTNFIYDYFKCNALIRAASSGDKKQVQKLIEQKKYDLNASNEDSETALDLATLQGHYEIVELLVKNGANINLKTPKSITKQNCSSLELFIYLLHDFGNSKDPKDQEGYKKNLSNLLKTFQTMLRLGAEFDQRNQNWLYKIYTNEALLKTYDEYYDQLKKSCLDSSNLPIACINIIAEYTTIAPEILDLLKNLKNDDVASAMKIIKQKHNAKTSLTEYTENIPGFTASIFLVVTKDAMKTNNFDLIEDLLKQELIDIDEPSAFFIDKANPLTSAIQANNIKMVEFLLNKDADPNYKCEPGKTPHYMLLLSCQPHVDIEITKLLLKFGAGVNAKSARGVTALLMAASRGDINRVKLLVNAKADIKIVDYKNKNAIEIARMTDHNDIADYLQKQLEPQENKEQDSGIEIEENIL